MPVYTYRRDDGTTFDYRQKFTDEPLKVDPVTGQPVVRVVHAAGIVFKGSGFYVNDSRDSSRKSASSTPKANGDGKTESKSDASAGSKEGATDTPKATAKADVSAAAD